MSLNSNLEENVRQNHLKEDFAQAYTMHGPGILKYLLSVGMQTADAQDVLQNSFLSMWELRGRIQNTENLAPLWFTIAKHNLYDFFRKNRRSISLSSEIDHLPAPGNVFREMDHAYLRRRITEALCRLPEDVAEAYRLTKISGLSVRETSGILNLSETDVKSKVFRARKKLIRELADLEDF